jgi:predicted phosphohydrolase
MNVWAISDLHLSFARPERRERYAARWRDHAVKIEQNWREVVRPRDLVLLPGDLSMARNHRELQPDLEWLGRLPGTKVLAPGNHDRWWNDVGAIRPLLRQSLVAGRRRCAIHGVVVCGRWVLPRRTLTFSGRRTRQCA